jgi:hypothetical protein
MKKRVKAPIRSDKAHSNAFIENIQQTIEDEYDLPRGSVKLVYPSGRKAYANSTVDAFRRHWDK